MSLKILVTGADGFVGGALCRALAVAGHSVRRAVRGPVSPLTPSTVCVGDIGPGTDWSDALAGMEVVVHLAARAHVMRESSDADAVRAAYFTTNADGTEALARAAAISGVGRLVFVSSVKVNGEATRDAPFRESDAPRPEDDYGRSKWAAEQRLAQVGLATGMQHVIVRPPLIYGPGVKGNLARLLRVVDAGVPLPLGSIDNRRSMIGLTNMVSALAACVVHPAAAGRTYLLSDGRDLSTPALVRCIAAALGRHPRLIPVPPKLMHLLARVARSGALARLVGSLQVDSSRIRAELGWLPPATVEEEILRMARFYAGSTGTGIQ